MRTHLAAAILSFSLTAAGPIAAQTMTAAMLQPTAAPVPLVVGEVTELTSHSVLVATPQGEDLLFEVDSRTVMPARIENGERVKIEFYLMESGDHRAGRITEIQPGSGEWLEFDREKEAAAAENATGTASPGAPAPAQTMVAAVVPPDAGAGAPESPSGASGERTVTTPTENPPAVDASTPAQLPQTGSPRPWQLAASAAFLALALGLGWSHRRRAKG